MIDMVDFLGAKCGSHADLMFPFDPPSAEQPQVMSISTG